MGVQLWAPPIPGPVQGPGQRTRLSPPVGGPACGRHTVELLFLKDNTFSFTTAPCNY